MKFSDIKEPRLLCLIAYAGGGTKLFQGYLDGHPEIYNIPMYPMLYFYPHWETWEQEYQEVWNWDTIINIFRIKHASVIDSRNIIGLNGLHQLGEDKSGHVSIDGEKFRSLLKEMLRDEPIRRRTFLLAVNYAYSICKGEDLARKKVLLWHHHVTDRLDKFISDFPEAPIVATIRDPRIKFYKLYDQWMKEVDRGRLNATDAMIYRWNLFDQLNKYMFMVPDRLKKFTNAKNIFFLKHEDMAADSEAVMRRTADFMGVRFLDLMLESTFDGKVWWVPDQYEIPRGSTAGSANVRAGELSQEVLKKVLSTDWKQQKSFREIFIFEGMKFDFLKKYGYEPFYYKRDSLVERFLWAILVLLPYQIEVQDTLYYLNPRTHGELVLKAWKEAQGEIKRKYYGFNAAYFYKFLYKHLKLWRRPFFIRWLDDIEKIKNKTAYSKSVFTAASILYVMYVYFRFWKAIILLPFRYLRRLGIYYGTFFKRIFIGDLLAPLI